MNTPTRGALRASLKQEDVALDRRLPEVAPTRPQTRPGAASPSPPARPGKIKPEKRQRETLYLAASDLRRLDALRTAMKAAGRPARKSELVRAGLAALAALDHAGAVALLDALPALKRNAAKDEKARGGKKTSPKRKAAARKR
ncbi:MAG: hypothetical protein KUL79_15590 [Thauera sp.]|nr:hypothetical protein [Thauera sp.]